MKVIEARNVQQALPEAIRYLMLHGVERESRNGPVLQAPEPVTTVYAKPTERVLFWPERDANPTFHLMEAMWMLAGRNDVAFPSQFVKRMHSFSDDGETFNAAYGHRWRNHFDTDQLAVVAEALRTNPTCRRQVVQMWDARHDLGLDSNDLPCNTQIYFQINPRGELDMMVNCRSNDIIWGCYGANVVHMSILHEFMAAWSSVPVGRYWQVSMNWHAYLKTLEPMKVLAERSDDVLVQKAFADTPLWDMYGQGHVRPFPLISKDVMSFQRDLVMFLDEGLVLGLNDPFIKYVLAPIMRAHNKYKSLGEPDRFIGARRELETCRASDWKLACTQWYNRREEAWKNRSTTQ